jgi:tetratricopeptide (TPR) repeat protein
MKGWEKLKEEGQKFYQDSQWSKAINCYTKAIALNPTSADLYSNRAFCELQLSNFARAREDAENAIRIDPKVVEYYRTLSRALQGLKLHQESAKACRAGLEADPRDDVVLSRLFEAQQLNKTAERQQTPSQDLGDDASTVREKADRNFKDGGSGIKVRDKKYLQDLDNFFNRPKVPGELAATPEVDIATLTSEFADMTTRAVRGSTTALKYLRAHELMLDAFNEEGPNVFRLFREANKLWDKVPDAPGVLVKFQEMAEATFKQNPKNVDVLHFLVVSEIWRRSGDLERLISMAKTCVALEPGASEFHVTLGNLYGKVNDIDNAVKCYDRALELEWDPQVLYLKGCAISLSIQAGETLKVLEEYVEASEEDEPNVPLACYIVAHLYLTIGDRQKAEEYWRRGQESEIQSVKLPFREPHAQMLDKWKDKIQLLMKSQAATGRVLSEPKLNGSTDHDHDDDVKCAACGKTATALSKCGRCERTRYCGRACQEKHWPTHKKSCSKNQLFSPAST